MSMLAGCGVLALLSTPALADSGWDEVGALLIGITCLILIIATAVTINATRKVVIVPTLLVVGGMSWLLASEVVVSVLDIWAFLLACFVVLTIACALKLWRLGKGSGRPPPPNASLERTRDE
jgi:uncharacterized membrane protein